MTYSPLGRSGIKISKACLGTMNFGVGKGMGSVDEAEARQIIDRFLDAGHNLIDTANVYNGGQAEEFVGRAVKSRREAAVIATKAFLPQGNLPNDSGLSRLHLTRALDGSLRRLGTDYIDLYQANLWDPVTPIEETVATLDSFVQAGKIRYYGCANFTAAQVVESQWAARRIGAEGYISLQAQYSLINRDIEADILRTCERQGLGVLTYASVAGGVLAGRYRRDTEPDRDSRLGRLFAIPAPSARRWAEELLNEHTLDIADTVREVADAVGSTSAAVAHAWLAANPAVAGVITGPRTVEQHEENMSGFDLNLPEELVARLDQVSGPAPRPVTGIRHAV
ncbi:aldo/keto reductase [Micromonospora sp. DT233]|uniref:aldo/keto reductase n=1 Tax=Micromonospora sp. DT233 TaxID=3393432 RepID=UPI003CF30E87